MEGYVRVACLALWFVNLFFMIYFANEVGQHEKWDKSAVTSSQRVWIAFTLNFIFGLGALGR